MKTALFSILLILIMFLSVFAVHAADLTVENFDSEYKLVQENYATAEAKMTKKLRKKFRDAKHNKRIHMSDREVQIKKEFQNAESAKLAMDHMNNLRSELIKMYHAGNPPSTDQNKLNRETTMLMLEVFSETEKLKKQYRSFGVAIMHNMMIDLGIRKRGACKDWAEDLLNHVIPLEREFFHVTWGEANPKKITEHNVLVIYPKHAEFKDGLVIDPWRTSGKVFWVYTTKDRHYKWKPWKDFGVF